MRPSGDMLISTNSRGATVYVYMSTITTKQEPLVGQQWKCAYNFRSDLWRR
jgi:hypothetical protein